MTPLDVPDRDDVLDGLALGVLVIVYGAGRLLGRSAAASDALALVRGDSDHVATDGGQPVRDDGDSDGQLADDPSGPVITVWLPTIEGPIDVQVMEGPDELDPYFKDDGTMGASETLDVLADYTEDDLDRGDVENIPARDASALFDHIVQDASRRKAVVPDGWGPDDG